MHALCGVTVEGVGGWTSYRDALTWCQAEHVTYNELPSMSPDAPRAPDQIQRVLSCI